MNRPSATGIAVVGAALIALSFGLSRFAFGLFLPAMKETLSLSPEAMGMVAAQAYFGFGLASVIASGAAEKLGARWASAFACGMIIVGFLLIAYAPDSWILGAGVFACGLGTGMMMPALSSGVEESVRPGLRSRVNAVMNAGTSIGIMISVPAVIFFSNSWRDTYRSFGLVALVGLFIALMFLPRSRRKQTDVRGLGKEVLLNPYLVRLLLLAFGMGVVSSVYWIFAPDLVVEKGGLGASDTGLLWLVLGIFGLGGAIAGDLLERYGACFSHAIGCLLLCLGLVLAASFPSSLSWTVLSAATFGFAYMLLCGIYLVMGVRLIAQRPSLGAVLAFLATTLGQAVGAPVSGWAVQEFGHSAAFLGFAGGGSLLIVLSVQLRAGFARSQQTEGDTR